MNNFPFNCKRIGKFSVVLFLKKEGKLTFYSTTVYFMLMYDVRCMDRGIEA